MCMVIDYEIELCKNFQEKITFSITFPDAMMLYKIGIYSILIYLNIEISKVEKLNQLSNDSHEPKGESYVKFFR